MIIISFALDRAVLARRSTQLKKYANERIHKVATQLPLQCLILVYNGWELVYRAEWQAGEETAAMG